jgi:hypothetical protein
VNDLKSLFELALDDSLGPRAADPGDPTADLERGRKLLRQRTRRRVLGAAAATVAVAAVAVAAVPAVAHDPAKNAATASSARPATRGITLVAYTGAQPQGYVVTVIPAGWVIQGSDPYSLVIAPENAANTNPDSFVGKLLVTQENFDTSNAQGWSPAPARGRTAYYSVQNAAGVPTASLVVEEKPSQWLLVQVPVSLGWTEKQLTQFALGVTILPTAQEGHG